jgi:hypothetical protein
MHTASRGSGSVRSNWSFGDLPDGDYQVFATWRIGSTYATNAPYLLYNGEQLVGSTRVNQRRMPSGVWDGTTHWQSLATVSVTGGRLVVVLTNAASGTVVSDAVRIERVPPSGATLVPPMIEPDAPVQWLAMSLASAHRATVPVQAPAAAQGSVPTTVPPNAPWWLLSASQQPDAAWHTEGLDLVSGDAGWIDSDDALQIAAVDALMQDLSPL